MNTAPDASLDQLLLEWLQRHPEGVSEHQLMQELDAAEHPILRLNDSEAHSDHRLFRRHFRLFHMLYRLRDRCWTEQSVHIEIGPLRIRALPYSSSHSQLPGHSDPLREYYLDWSHYADTSAEDVDEMLGRFWVRLQGHEQRDAALALLGLDADVDYEDIRRRYRRLAMEHHPDRGGDKKRLQEINAAMDLLAKAHGKTGKR